MFLHKQAKEHAGLPVVFGASFVLLVTEMTGAMKGRLLQWSHFNGIFLFFSLSLSLFFFWLSELTTSTLSCFVPTSPNLVRLWGFGSPPHTHRSSHRVHFGIPKLSTSLPYKSREQSPAQRRFPHGGRERHILVFSSRTDAKCYSSCAADAVWQHWHFSSDRWSVPF